MDGVHSSRFRCAHPSFTAPRRRTKNSRLQKVQPSCLISEEIGIKHQERASQHSLRIVGFTDAAFKALVPRRVSNSVDAGRLPGEVSVKVWES